MDVTMFFNTTQNYKHQAPVQITKRYARESTRDKTKDKNKNRYIIYV